MMTENEIEKAFDILDKFEFFGGQRAGRELWFNKPTDIQNKDIGGFLRDLDFLKQFINRQNAEIERLEEILGGTSKVLTETCAVVRAEAIKEFAERVKERAKAHYFDNCCYAVSIEEIDNLVEEMVGEG